jgi:glucuronokinase
MGLDMIRISSPARAGILGNPSDGFFGKTIASPVRNFYAEIILFEWDRIEILPGQTDRVNFSNLDELIYDIKINGYYGGFRLIKAAIKQFYNYLKLNDISIDNKKFAIRYSSNIPRQVGLAGSSALITSTINALSKFYDVSIDKPVLANYVLWSEVKELGISAGLQDRVVQVYNEPVYMDFEKTHMEKMGYGNYQTIDSNQFPPMFLAYRVDLTHEATAHNDIRKRWERGELKIRETMIKIAQNAENGFDALKESDREQFINCINKNFDLRSSIYPISEKNLNMIQLARKTGASAKFPGSGGAIIGSFEDEPMLSLLKEKFQNIGCKVVKMNIHNPKEVDS